MGEEETMYEYDPHSEPHQEEKQEASSSTGEELKYEKTLWKQYPAIHSRVYHGKHAVKEISILLEKNKKALETYGKGVKKYTITTEDFVWGLKKPLVGLKNYYVTINEAMLAAAEREHALHKEMKEYKLELKHANSQHEKTLNRLKKEYDGFVAEAKSREKTERNNAEALKKAVMTLEKAREEKNPEKQKKAVDKAELGLSNAKSKAITTREDYASAVVKLQHADEKYYEGIDDLLRQVEDFDRTRIRKTKEFMLAIAETQLEMLNRMTAAAADYKERVEAINVDEDIQTFIKETIATQNENEKEPPSPPVKFIPYFASQKGYDDPLNTTQNDRELDPKAPLAEKEGTPVGGDKSVPSPDTTLKQTNPPPPPQNVKPTTTAPKELVTALFDFDDPNDEETLSFKAGDKIEVIAKEGEWWRGRLNGKEGVFPYNYMEGYENDEQQEEETTGETVVAEFPYDAQADEELNLEEGDIITVLHTHDDGWHEGINQRTKLRGLFPANYTKPQ